MRHPNALPILLAAAALTLSGCTGSTPDAAGDDTSPTAGDTDTSSPIDTDSGGDDGGVVYSENFDRSESELEHDGYPYFESLQAMCDSMGCDDYDPGWWTEGVVPIDSPTNSQVYGLLLANSYLGSSDPSLDLDSYWTYPGEPIDLTSCTSGTVTFTWGVTVQEGVGNGYYMSLKTDTSVVYYGMGESEDYPCTGTLDASFESPDDKTTGPYQVSCPIDYDCGYESAGTFGIRLFSEFRCEDAPCDADVGEWFGALLWVDDIKVTLE